MLRTPPPTTRQLRSVPPPPPRSGSVSISVSQTKSTPKIPSKPITLTKCQTNLNVYKYHTPSLPSLSSLSSLTKSCSSYSYQYQYTSPKSKTSLSSPKNQLKHSGLPPPKYYIKSNKSNEGPLPTPRSPVSVPRISISIPLPSSKSVNNVYNINRTPPSVSPVSPPASSDAYSNFSFSNLTEIQEGRKQRLSVSSSRSSRSSRSSSYCSSRSGHSPRNDIIRKKKRRRKSVNKKTSGKHINCICGRFMDLTSNPKQKYPPNAVLYCQQNSKCKKKLVMEKDIFYACKKRTKYHNTRNKKYYICYSCAVDNNNKIERMKKNYQLLIKQTKNKEIAHVHITNETKNYILSSNNTTLKNIYIDNKQPVHTPKLAKSKSNIVLSTKTKIKNNKSFIIKQGYMMKKGNFWNKKFQKRFMKLCTNKQLYYYRNKTDSKERGIADLREISNIAKKGKTGLEISTPTRQWKFLCNNANDRDHWFVVIQKLDNQSNINNGNKDVAIAKCNTTDYTKKN